MEEVPDQDSANNDANKKFNFDVDCPSNRGVFSMSQVGSYAGLPSCAAKLGTAIGPMGPSGPTGMQSGLRNQFLLPS